MTYAGVANKSLILFALLLMTFIYSWNKTLHGLMDGVAGQTSVLMWGGAIAGFILAIITIFKKQWAPFTAPAYALCEGLFLGAISALYNYQFQGIVFNAVSITFGVFFALLLMYRWGLIRATPTFKKVMFAAIAGIGIVYLLSFVLSFFSIQVPFIHSSGIMGVGFSLFVVVIAALSLVLDFDSIEQGVQMGAPKYLEWYSSFALLVTIIWLYLEILRLLSKLNSRD
jgi:uncharacterized YccA/Bax inhibitor family protein